MIIYYLNMVAAVVAILAAGYILATIHMRMRVLASGSLLAFGILQLHNDSTTLQAIHLITHISIVGCVVYFATVANTFVNLSAVSKVASDKHQKRKSDIEVSTDFPPSNALSKETENVVHK